jgi:hypothetical protein
LRCKACFKAPNLGWLKWIAVQVGQELLELARSTGARSIFVVGTGRNVGKTTALRAIYEAAWRQGLRVGLASVGRDATPMWRGESLPKPRLWLRPGTAFATARPLLARSPAAEILKLSGLTSAAGGLLYARTLHSGFYELGGPPTASGVREVVDELLVDCDFTIVDGAVDRVAALAGSNGAIVVACGAAAANTLQEAAEEIAALVARLRTGSVDPAVASIEVKGALTAAQAAAWIASRETRQIVVQDPTQVALSGRAALEAFARLQIRCRRPLRVIAATIASIGIERSFEPHAFARAVGAATGLPTFDVYAGSAAA